MSTVSAYDQAFFNTLMVTGVIFILAQLALGWAIFKYRSNGGRAAYSHGNNKLEILWTSAAALLFVGAGADGHQHLGRPSTLDRPLPPTRSASRCSASSSPGPSATPASTANSGRPTIKLINDAAGNPFGVSTTPIRTARTISSLRSSTCRPASHVVLMLKSPRCHS